MRPISKINFRDAIGRILRSKDVGTYSVMVSANMLATIITGIAGIVQARWVTPEMLGAFGKYAIVTTYAAFLSMVVVEGLVRQFPYLIGKGQTDLAVKTAGVAKCWYALISSGMTVLFLTLSIRALCARDYVGVVGWGTQIFSYLTISYGAFQQIIYRRSGEFKRLSYNGLTVSFLSFAALCFVRLWGFFGLAMRMVTIHFSRLCLDARYLPMKIPFYWDRGLFVGLAKISIPISLIGYLKTSFVSSSFNSMVLLFCGQRDLGLLGIASSFQSMAMMFIQSFNQLFGVKLAVKFGETESVSKTLRTVAWPTALCFASSFALAVVFCIVIVPFVKYVTPNYVDAIPVVWVLAATIPISALALPVEILKTALMIKNMYVVGIARVVAVLSTAAIVPHRIEWLASSLVVGNVVETAVGYWYILRMVKEEQK